MVKVLITGADGFVGKNLRLRLAERKDVQIITFTRQDEISALDEKLSEVDFVFHLAGVNRPSNPDEFELGNTGLTEMLATALSGLAARTGRAVPVLLTSSIHALRENAYGISKRGAEQALAKVAAKGIPTFIFRLPNVFGKWCRPNYNSAVATFCYNVANGLPIEVNDPAAQLTLVYIDDVIDAFVRIMDGEPPFRDPSGYCDVTISYRATVGELAELIQGFRESRDTLITGRVGTGLVRALYSTYVSYLPKNAFSYHVPKYGDQRGVFVEMLKTPDAGQFSYFTAHPGITRGGHYHHTKTEKFLVIKGQALFKFRQIETGETYELMTDGETPEIVETVPGWTHDITNVGIDEMVVMLWANEIFDRARPDTYACPL